jgi:hypothetical protein
MFLNAPPSIVITLLVNIKAGAFVVVAHKVSSALPNTRGVIPMYSTTTLANVPCCTLDIDNNGDGGSTTYLNVTLSHERVGAELITKKPFNKVNADILNVTLDSVNGLLEEESV